MIHSNSTIPRGKFPAQCHSLLRHSPRIHAKTPSPPRALATIVRPRFGAPDAFSPAPCRRLDRPCPPGPFRLRPAGRARAAARRDGAGAAGSAGPDGPGRDAPLPHRHAAKKLETGLHDPQAAFLPRPPALSFLHAPFLVPRRRDARRGRRSFQARGRGRDAVLLLFDGDAGAALPSLRRRLRGPRRARLLRHEGQLEPGGARDPCAPRRRHGHRLGGRVAPGARGGGAGRADRVLRRRQDARGDGRRPRRPASFASTSNRSRSFAPSPRSPSPKGRQAPISIRVNPDVDAKTHRKISTGKSENKFGIPISRARRSLRRGGQARGAQGDRRRHAYRQPDHRPRTLRQRRRRSSPSSRAT